MLSQKFKTLKFKSKKNKLNIKKSKRSYLFKLESKKTRSLSTKLKLYKINFVYKKLKTMPSRRSRQKLKSNLLNSHFVSLAKVDQSNKQSLKKLVSAFSYFVKNKLNQNLETLTEVISLNKHRRKYLKKLTTVTTLTRNTYYNYTLLIKKNINKSNPYKNIIYNFTTTLKLNNTHNLVCNNKILYTQNQILLSLLVNPMLLKFFISKTSFNFSDFLNKNDGINTIQNILNKSFLNNNIYTNLIPNSAFNKNLSKTVLNSFKNNFFQENVIS